MKIKNCKTACCVNPFYRSSSIPVAKQGSLSASQAGRPTPSCKHFTAENAKSAEIKHSGSYSTLCVLRVLGRCSKSPIGYYTPRDGESFCWTSGLASQHARRRGLCSSLRSEAFSLARSLRSLKPCLSRRPVCVADATGRHRQAQRSLRKASFISVCIPFHSSAVLCVFARCQCFIRFDEVFLARYKVKHPLKSLSLQGRLG